MNKRYTLDKSTPHSKYVNLYPLLDQGESTTAWAGENVRRGRRVLHSTD